MALKASFLACGLTTRVHRNTSHAPKNALKFDEIKNLVNFIIIYAERHAILLPGRIPGYKNDRMQLLPSSTTKKVYSTCTYTCTCTFMTLCSQSPHPTPHMPHACHHPVRTHTTYLGTIGSVDRVQALYHVETADPQCNDNEADVRLVLGMSEK